MIAIDPDKASHTAVAIDGVDEKRSSVKVRAHPPPVEQLLNWDELDTKKIRSVEP